MKDYQIEKDENGQWIITRDSNLVAGPFNEYSGAERALTNFFNNPIGPFTDFTMVDVRAMEKPWVDPTTVPPMDPATIKAAFDDIAAEIEHKDNFKQMLYEAPALLHAFWEFAGECRTRRVKNA